jgi:hypothetical protein
LIFPATARSLARLVEVVEELVEGFNEDFAKELEPQAGSLQEDLPAVTSPNLVDAAALENEVIPATRQHTAFLVDMARAEALDALGDHREAVTLIDRYV